jgi:C1A family cysteine protease
MPTCWICNVIYENDRPCIHNLSEKAYGSKKCWKCGITYEDDNTTTCATCWGPLWSPKQAQAHAEEAKTRLGGGWACRNGHWVPSDMIYCPYCGSGGKNPTRKSAAASGYQGKPLSLKQRRLDGCLFETSRKAAAPTLTVQRGAAPDRIDLRQYCSPVEDQGQTNSCTANACAGALEYHQRRMGGAFTDISRLYVYYNARKMADTQGQDTGSFIHHVMASVLAHGACEEAVWPFDLSLVLQPPPREAYQNATSHEAVQYARAPLGQPALQALAAGLPVVFGTFIPSRFFDEAAKTGMMPSPDGSMEPPAGGHAMLLVGYDLPSRTWLVRNSWGSNWADGGYFRVPFATLEAYSIPDQFWTIGAIETTNGLSLSGFSSAAAAKDTEAHAAAEAKAALAKLKAEVRTDLQGELDATKKAIKDRLRGE